MRTYYENAFTKPVKNKSEYIYKMQCLIYNESAIQLRNNPTLIFLEQKLLFILNH